MLDLGRVKNFAEMTVKLTPSMSGGKTPLDGFPWGGSAIFLCPLFNSPVGVNDFPVQANITDFPLH